MLTPLMLALTLRAAWEHQEKLRYNANVTALACVEVRTLGLFRYVDCQKVQLKAKMRA